MDEDVDDPFRLRTGASAPFFGWPDYFHSLTVQPAVAELGYHTSANKLDFATSEQFKQQGDLFVAYTGSFVPIDVKFQGDATLIADFGVFEPGINLAQPNTGKVWAICHGAAACKKLRR